MSPAQRGRSRTLAPLGDVRGDGGRELTLRDDLERSTRAGDETCHRKLDRDRSILLVERRVLRAGYLE